MYSCGNSNLPVKFTVTDKGNDSHNEQLVDVTLDIKNFDIGDNTFVNINEI